MTRTFAKYYTDTIVAGVVIDGVSESIVLSSVNSCRIKSVSMGCAAFNDATEYAVDVLCSGSIQVPVSSIVADSEAIFHQDSIQFDDKKEYSCDIYVPASKNINLVLELRKKLAMVDDLNTVLFIYINYEEIEMVI